MPSSIFLLVVLASSSLKTSDAFDLPTLKEVNHLSHLIFILGKASAFYIINYREVSMLLRSIFAMQILCTIMLYVFMLINIFPPRLVVHLML